MPLNTAATRNLAVIVGVTLLLRRIDENDERVILFVRALFFLYVVSMSTFSFLTLRSILAAHDERRVRTPPSPNGVENQSRSQTVHEYDIRELWTKTRGWMINASVLAVLHSRSWTVAPLVTSCLLGLINAWSDQLTMIHLRGYKDEGALERPWKVMRGPFRSLLGGLSRQMDKASRPEMNAVHQNRAARGRKDGECEADAAKLRAGGERLRRRVKTDTVVQEVESNPSDLAGGVEDVKVE